jgi:hypothetical protein
MDNWYGVPTIKNGKASIVVGNDKGRDSYTEINLSLKEAEDLAWRLKQAIQLLKNGKISKQRA